MTSREEAIAAFGLALSEARNEMAAVYQREGAMGVARAARPNGSDEELQALAAKYERMVAAERAKRRVHPAAANQ